MTHRVSSAALLGFAVACSAALAAPDIHEGHDHSHGSVRHDEPRHRPHGAGDHAGHAHPGVDLSHPIVIESPLPETKLRVNYSFSDGGDESAHVAEIEAEYAFTQNFSIEAVLPYVFLNPDDGASENGLGDSIIAFKFASYAWIDQRVLPAVGFEVILPTADEEKGLGSDHVVELEPFFRIGYWSGPFEFIGSVSVGIPLNQTDEESEEEDFALGYGVSVLYHAAPSLQALVEFHGESVYGAEDVHAFYISPGATFQPFADKSINVGVGATLPVTDDRDFDYAINVMSIFHF
ncbi:MAG TPA: transporter [Tepidisphaeraceae bacterium]|jgi:hypothetical protein